MSPPPSARQHPSYGDCLEVKREHYQNSSVLDCVTQCSQSAAHLYEQFLQVKQIGFVTLGPLCCRRGGCLELYYCNMVEWFWWDSSLISTTNWFPSVLWHCWFGHLACKNRPQNDLLCVKWDVKTYTLTHSHEYFDKGFSGQEVRTSFKTGISTSMSVSIYHNQIN